MEIKDIEKLAKLARIELSEAEKQAYLKDISAILGYVDQIKEVVGKVDDLTQLHQGSAGLKNVMRGDDNPNDSGASTETIVAEFPRSEKNYLKVKKIL